MSPRHSNLIVAIVVVLVLALIPVQVGAAAQADVAKVRFAAMLGDGTPLDFYVDGEFQGGNTNGATGYFDVAPGEHTFSFRAVYGADDLGSATSTLTGGQYVTVAALNSADALQAVVLQDIVAAPARYAAHVKIVNAGIDAPPVTVNVGETVLASDLAFGQASVTQQVYAGKKDVTVTAVDGTVITSVLEQSFIDYKSYTLFLAGRPGAYRLDIFESLVLNPDNTSMFRFANMIQGIGPVDVYVDKEPDPLYRGVPEGTATTFFVTGTGPHIVDVIQTSTGTPIANGAAEIGPNQDIIFILKGTPEAPEVITYDFDISPLPPNSARIQVLNLVPGGQPIQLSRMEGDVLLDSVAENTPASRVMPAGTYNIRLSDLNGEKLMERGGFHLLDGWSLLMLVYDPDPNDPALESFETVAEHVKQMASVRLAHWNARGPAVDIYLDGQPVVSGMVYKDVIDYTLIEPKVYTLATYTAGADPATTEPLYSVSMELAGENFPRTIFVYGNDGEAKLGVAPDSLEMMPADGTRIRFINSAVYGEGFAVKNPSDGSVAADDMFQGTAGANIALTTGVFNFDFVAGEGIIASVEGMTLEPGIVYTVVLAGVYGEDPGVEIIVLEATP